MVYLWLQPYLQNSVGPQRQLKLSSNIMGHMKFYTKQERWFTGGNYLQGQKYTQCFMCPHLRKQNRNLTITFATLPPEGGNGQFTLEPVAVLERRLIKRNKLPVAQALVQWSQTNLEDASWRSSIVAKFYNFNR